MRAARDSFLNPLLSLALCALAGTLFAWLKTPLPWVIGPLTAMAVCNFGGLGLRAPFGGREVGQVIIGTALGLYFTPAVAREVASYWPILLLAALLAILLGAVSGWFLSRATGTDRATAFFATISSVSPRLMRRSEWPTKQNESVNSFSIAGEISPVKAPSLVQDTS